MSSFKTIVVKDTFTFFKVEFAVKSKRIVTDIFHSVVNIDLPKTAF